VIGEQAYSSLLYLSVEELYKRGCSSTDLDIKDKGTEDGDVITTFPGFF
jgi:hypothetical protein